MRLNRATCRSSMSLVLIVTFLETLALVSCHIDVCVLPIFLPFFWLHYYYYPNWGPHFSPLIHHSLHSLFSKNQTLLAKFSVVILIFRCQLLHLNSQNTPFLPSSSNFLIRNFAPFSSSFLVLVNQKLFHFHWSFFYFDEIGCMLPLVCANWLMLCCRWAHMYHKLNQKYIREDVPPTTTRFDYNRVRGAEIFVFSR